MSWWGVGVRGVEAENGASGKVRKVKRARAEERKNHLSLSLSRGARL